MLECFTAEQPALRNKDLADRVGISRPTANRYGHWWSLAISNRTTTAGTGSHQAPDNQA
jgi:hypothetical protein